jgi:hypothetical protein
MDASRRISFARRSLVLTRTLAPLLAAACSGGGGGGPSTSIGFATNVGQTNEGAAPLSVQVVLHTSLASLASTVSVDVVDLMTGTATSGTDYAAFAPTTITFPAGSMDGDAQWLPLAATADLSVEGRTETVRLGFANAVGCKLGGFKAYTASFTDADVATIRFASSVASTTDESAGTTNVTVVLDLPAAVSLGVPVSARVADTHTGSATSGADYTAFPSQAVTFPAGSVDGATQTVGIQVLADATIETNETVELALSSPSAGAVLGATSSFQLSIVDDDASGPPALVATEGPTGVESSVAYDQQLELGTQTVDAGPNAGTLLRIQNVGGSGMSLGAPELAGANANDFAVEIEAAPMPPSGLCADDAPRDEVDSPILATSGLGPREGAGVAIALDASRLRGLAAKTRVALRGVPAPGLPSLTLDLERLPLPIASDAVLRVDGVDVPGGPRAVLGNLTLWRGAARGIEGSRVFLALSSAGVRGFLELPFADNRLVHYATGSDLTGLAVDDRDLASLGFERPAFDCPELRPPGSAPRSPRAEGSPRTGDLSAADCRVAVETDWQLYQKFGSVGGVTSYVTGLFSAVGDRYFTDIQTTMSIAYLGIYTTAADPWTSQDSGGNSSALLAEFVDAWTPNAWPASANLAHFVSGANLGGGVAYLDVLCNQSFGFGVSGNVAGNIDWSTWTGQPGTFTWDFVVVAHEIGHNFGSQHTHSYCPPLDVCYTNCTGTTSCSQGTIMSYCHTCGGMDNIDLVFHPNCANIMRQNVDASCLGLSALAAGDYVQYLVRFNPLTTTGSRTADLTFEHDAPNTTQPFKVRLHGTAQ